MDSVRQHVLPVITFKHRAKVYKQAAGNRTAFNFLSYQWTQYIKPVLKLRVADRIGIERIDQVLYSIHRHLIEEVVGSIYSILYIRARSVWRICTRALQHVVATTVHDYNFYRASLSGIGVLLGYVR